MAIANGDGPVGDRVRFPPCGRGARRRNCIVENDNLLISLAVNFIPRASLEKLGVGDEFLGNTLADAE